MTPNEVYDIFEKTRLFANSKHSTIEYASEHCTLCPRKKGEEFVFSETSPALYVILDGTASVLGISKNKRVILNTLTKYSVFGMASLFGETCPTTSVIAKNDCLYAVITQNDVEKMLGKDAGFAKNYIKFLSDKIRFLNKKIAFFTSESAEKKVANYLLSLNFDKNTQSAELNVNMSFLAQNLDIGRASLYRAFDSLENKRYIKRENNTVKFISYDEFKNIYGEKL